jgi:uncharacterized membrane protein YfcA
VDGLIVAGVIALATLVGATIQGSIGFGVNLVTVPVLALVLPDALPATVVLIGIPLALAMVRHEIHAVDRPGLAWIIVGRVPGTLAGTWLVTTLSPDGLKVLIGVCVFLAATVSLFIPPIRLRPANQMAGGFAAGITGTAAGIGGPPVALLYQHHPGPAMRATVSAAFFFGALLSATSLAVAGEVRAADVAIAAGLLPMVLIGSVLGRRSHDLLDRRWLRPAVLGFAAVSSVVAIVTALI